LLGACGSTYTKGEFTHQADAICASALRQLRALAPPSFAGTTSHRRRTLSTYSSRALGISEAERRQLRALPRPSQSAHEGALLRRYLSALARAVTDLRSLAAAERAGDAAAAAAATSSLAGNPVGGLAAAYGLRSCASAGATYR
jgi:hypothetical protein